MKAGVKGGRLTDLFRDSGREFAAGERRAHLLPEAALSRRQALAALCALPAAFQAQGGVRWDRRAEVVIAGAGGAGLAAAAAAARVGAKVLVLEKEAAAGGNTRIASGYITGAWERFQRPAGIVDSPGRFAADMMRNAGASADPVRVRILAKESPVTLEWLQGLGLSFQNGAFVVSGEHFPRAYKPVAAMGEGYITVLEGAARAAGARIEAGCAVTGLVLEGGAVAGVRVRGSAGRSFTVRAEKGVLIASGGFCASDAMIRRYAPSFAGLTHDNAPGSTGELIEAAAEAGADLVDMDRIQCQPGCPPGRSHRVRLHNEPCRFILVNSQGRRFIREDARRDVLRDAVLSLPGRLAFAIVDSDGLRQYNRLIQKEAVWGVETGDAFNDYTVAGLAAKLGVPPRALSETITNYNDAVAVQHDRLGKDMTFCHPIAKPPFWACFAAMTRHASEGGIRVDAAGRVLGRSGKPIAGLWAAGEATGGLHGKNQMGGNGLADALTFGRLAGAAMAEERGSPQDCAGSSK